MRGRWAILAAVAIGFVGAVGCGGSKHARVDPDAMLDSAAAHPVMSADTEIDLRLRVEGVPGISGPIRLRLEGPYRSSDRHRIPSFDWRISASALGFPIGGRVVSTGENVYLTVYGSQYEVGDGAVAAANRRLEGAGGLRLDLRRWLGRARVTGETSAGGVDCERIAAPLRGERVRRDLAPLASELGLPAVGVSGRAVACVGFDDRVLHELELNAVLAVSPEEGHRLGGATRARIGAVVVLSDVGEAQSISAPGGSFRPIRDLFLTLRDFGVPIPLG